MIFSIKNTLYFRGLFSFCCILLLFSCQSEIKNEENENTLSSFLEKQIIILNDRKAFVNKTVSIDSIIEKKVIKNINWKTEFEMFFQSDILKSSFNGRYEVKINDHQILYTILPNQSVPVKYLKINYGDDIKQIIKIEAMIDQSNYFYQTVKHLEMNFEKKNEKMFLKNYSIKGKRKLIFTSEVNFSINGEIVE